MGDEPTPKKKPFSSSSNSVNEKMFFGTRYEVKCDETFAFYEGYVYHYDDKEEKVKVAYPWRSDQCVPVNYVRPLAPPIAPHWKPKQGDHVECQAKAEESEPYGWWDCSIKTVRDNLYLITYEGWDNHHEVLQHNMLRPYNDQEAFSEHGVVRHYMSLSQDKINEFESSMAIKGDNGAKNALFMDQDNDFSAAQTTNLQLKRIALQIGLIHLNYCPTEKKLILIGQRQQVEDAKMLIDFVWSLKVQYSVKEDQVKKDEEKLQKEYDALSECVECKFRFDVFLTKYVIGSKGANVLNAKKIEGVKHINVRNISDTQSECLILATDQNAAEEARQILEMCQDFELIPRDVRKELIGKDGENIKLLEQRTKVIKICTLDHLKYINQNRYNQQQSASFLDEEDCKDPNLVKLIIIGPKEMVPFAKMLIKSNIASIQEKQKFIDRQNQARDTLYGGGGNGYDDGQGNGVQHWDQYGQQPNMPMNNNNGYKSVRRQRNSYKQQQQQPQTQRSEKDLSQDFNYLNNSNRDRRRSQNVSMNDDPHFPSLGAKGDQQQHQQQQHVNGDHNDSKDISHEDDDAYVERVDNREKSWVEHDEAGMDEDEDIEQENSNQRGNGSRRERGGYVEKPQRQKVKWRAKSSSSVTEEANETN